MLLRTLLTLFVAAWCLSVASAVEPKPPVGHQAQVAVSAAGRLDWVFALANQSPAEPPADWLPDYQSTDVRYELFVPADYNPRQKYPLVLFVSASDQAGGWKAWQAACQQQGVIFAAPHGAGNRTPMRQRLRMVLDVLDDVRRRYQVDTDRTYISGFSGGARAACAVAMALPELFGGVVPICAGGELRQETWLRQRVIARLSVALVTGENDFNRGEVERFQGPMLAGVGVRTRVWMVPKLGHGLPPGEQLTEVLAWLDQGAVDRGQLARHYPASRLDEPLSREAWSQALLAEAKQRLEGKTSLYSGLMQLQGISTRWSDLAAGQQAAKLLAEYDARADRPWDQDDIAMQRTFLIARARAVDSYGSGPLPKQYESMRKDMLGAAVELWELIVADGQDEAAVKEGKRRLPKLKQQLGE